MERPPHPRDCGQEGQRKACPGRALGAIAAILLMVLAPAWSARAQETYRLGEDDEWRSEGEIEPGTPEALLADARRQLADGRYDRAQNLASQWIERHPQNPRLPEAYLVRGDAKLAQRSYYDALFDYEYIAQQHPGSEVFVTALEREFEIAEVFVSGTRRKLWGLRIVRADDEAEELLIRIQERLPGSRLAEQAAMMLGDYYFSRQRMDLAAEMYAIFLENFPRSENVQLARKRLIYANLASFKGPEFDASGLFQARTRLRTLRVVDPLTAQQIGADALLTRINESLASKLLTTADWYWKTNDYIAAELTIRKLVRRYPRSIAAARALEGIPSLLAKLPPSVLAEAPDYLELRTAVLGLEDTTTIYAPPGAPVRGESTTPPPGEDTPVLDAEDAGDSEGEPKRDERNGGES